MIRRLLPHPVLTSTLILVWLLLANDLSAPQLLAVTDNVNQAKGDQGPESWKPSRTTYWCTYAKAWTTVKYKYGLKITSAEKSALLTMLDRC